MGDDAKAVLDRLAQLQRFAAPGVMCAGCYRRPNVTIEMPRTVVQLLRRRHGARYQVCATCANRVVPNRGH